MTENEVKIDSHFMNLVMMLQMSAMQAMGKVASPISGKVEKNLEQSRLSIDILNMIVEKTHGNLNQEEQKFINNILYNLRMNYLEESEKGEGDSEDTSGAKEAGEKSDEGQETGDNSEDDNQSSQENSEK